MQLLRITEVQTIEMQHRSDKDCQLTDPNAICGEFAVRPQAVHIAANLAIEPSSRRTAFRQLRTYIEIARPHHHVKNVLVIVGAALASIFGPENEPTTSVLAVLNGVIASCLIASSNYVLNEILDAKSDRFHPLKRERPLAARDISPGIAWCEYVLLGAAGQLMSAFVGWSFFSVAVAFQLMAVVYNVRPMRLKDVPYLDVLAEAVNSPLRLLLGWLIVSPSAYPQLSLILAFWMAGAFAMAGKRLKEYRFFRDPEIAAAYRKSFAHYNESRLKSCMAIYAIAILVFGSQQIVAYLSSSK